MVVFLLIYWPTNLKNNMSFNYPHTCPKIDKSIDTVKDRINNKIESIIEQLCPLIPTEDRRSLSNEWTFELYESIEDLIEEIRNTNINMRNSAEEQIVRLENDVDDLKITLIELENELSNN